MREFIKVSCVLVFMFAAPAAAVVWLDNRPTDLVRMLRIVFPTIAVLAISVFLKIHLRADLVPDYLHARDENYFNRAGFCFSFSSSANDGICYLHAWFQNQTDQPCRGRIALRPASDSLLGRRRIDTVVCRIACEPAAFGVATVAMRLPKRMQGTRQSFEVGASVDYPQGRGRTLRFSAGLRVRANADFDDAFDTVLAHFGAMAGSIVWSKPATVTMQLPPDVADEIVNPPQPEIVTFWKLGDPPLEEPA
jgi:hypothetical protein